MNQAITLGVWPYPQRLNADRMRIDTLAVSSIEISSRVPGGVRERELSAGADLRTSQMPPKYLMHAKFRSKSLARGVEPPVQSDFLTRFPQSSFHR
jgi:hypothetical protein